MHRLYAAGYAAVTENYRCANLPVMQTLSLPDGRTLAYETFGEADGRPVFFQHGTGDSRLARHPDESIAASLGVRLITADRPGVGGSTRKQHRTLLDWSKDAEALVDALGVERFAVAGWSGGGPHALAIAYALGDRVSSATIASSLAPFDDPGTRGMVLNRDLRMIWGLSHLKFVAAVAARVESRASLHDLSKFVDHIGKEAPADRAVLSDPQLHPMFEEEMAEALRQHGLGVLDDMWAFLDWKFVLEDVKQHVELFVGTSDEILSPEMSDRLASRLADSALHRWEDGGHYAVFAHWQEFLQATR
jgi:pimeloyl-ACP methyl ester carboxylesterase